MKKVYITYVKDGELYTKEVKKDYHELGDTGLKYTTKKYDDGTMVTQAEGVISVCIVDEKEGGNQ